MSENCGYIYTAEISQETGTWFAVLVTFLFGSCRRSSAALTHAKYEVILMLAALPTSFRVI